MQDRRCDGRWWPRRRRVVVALAAGSLTLSGACGEVARMGDSPVWVVVSRIEGASGAEPATFSAVLYSDVETLVEPGDDTGSVPTAYPDFGQAELRLAFKDPGAAVAPSDHSSVTITRYRVAYRRTDGRNAPGRDVPYAFEGAATRTIAASVPAVVGLELVRVQAKHEPPLRNLRGGGGALAISTIADVTFYGRDMSGRDVSASASISIVFADWADPR